MNNPRVFWYSEFFHGSNHGLLQLNMEIYTVSYAISEKNSNENVISK